MTGTLIAFEGLDQSGKQTQAEALRDALGQIGRRCELVSFPDYGTAIGAEIHRALHGAHAYAPDVMQLLYIANRYEQKTRMAAWLAEGVIVLCDRYLASSIAYGEAQGLDAPWLADIQRFLPQPKLTILLDILPETAARRKAADRDRYERDLSLLGRVRQSYLAQAARGGWALVDADRSREEVSRDVRAAVSRLGLL
ncbi:MAG: dTMP kinase [Chloroflexota bacterium]|nr:dTMP kinase [Chloroflexota bacterium]